MLWVTGCYRANILMEQRVFLTQVRADAKEKTLYKDSPGSIVQKNVVAIFKH